jgi:hypothetical protein
MSWVGLYYELVSPYSYLDWARWATSARSMRLGASGRRPSSSGTRCSGVPTGPTSRGGAQGLTVSVVPKPFGSPKKPCAGLWAVAHRGLDLYWFCRVESGKDCGGDKLLLR